MESLTPAKPEELDRSDSYREYYESRKPTNFGEKVLRHWHAKMYALAAKHIPGLHAKTVLEVGAGWGFFADACRARGTRYLGMEMNAAQAKALSAKGHEVVAGAVPPFPSGDPVQVIWMSHVLEHATTYLHAAQMVAAARDRLDRGGYLVVIGPDVKSWGAEFWNCDWSHGFPTTVHRVEQLMRESGFEIADARHHTATFGNPVMQFLATNTFRLVPYNVVDGLLGMATGRTFAYSFMAVFGWRQIFVVGRKP